jgi:hypothetical protein
LLISSAVWVLPLHERRVVDPTLAAESQIGPLAVKVAATSGDGAAAMAAAITSADKAPTPDTRNKVLPFVVLAIFSSRFDFPILRCRAAPD